MNRLTKRMNTLRDAAQRVLDLHDMEHVDRMRQFSHRDDWLLTCRRARDDLRAKLEQEQEQAEQQEPSPEDLGYVPLSDDGKHVFIDGFGEVPLDFEARAQKGQEPVQEDAALSAALGWPGGISDPVLDRTSLLQMVTTLSRQKDVAGIALQMRCWCEDCDVNAHGGLRTRMSLCPECGDKRCGRAAHHDFPCSTKPTGSGEPPACSGSVFVG